MMISRLALAAAIAATLPVAAMAQTQPDAAVPPDAQTTRPEQAADASETSGSDIMVTGKRFIDTGAQSAMKMDVRVLDTPFSVASYSEAFVKSLETTSVSDLYNYMTGIKKSGNTGYDITLRGFKTSGDDRNGIMVDGLPGLTGRYGSPPTIGVDHIELVKGPMSVLYGQIQPGGFLNLITKKPKAQFQATAELRATSFVSQYVKDFDRNSVTGAFDVTGPLDPNNVLLFRAVVEIGDRNGFRNFSFAKSQFFQPSMTFNIGPDTSLTAQVEYRHTREHFDQYLVAPPATVGGIDVYDVNQLADIRTVYQQPDDFREETGDSVNLYFKQGLGGDWRFNAGYRRVRYDSAQKEFSTTGFAVIQGAPRVLRRARNLETKRRYDYVDANVTGKFDTFGIAHSLLAGVNFGKDLVNENRLKFFNSSTRNTTTGACPAGGVCLDVALYDPIYTATPSFDSLPAINPQLTGQAILLTDRYVNQRNYGIYVSDLITFTDWLKVSVGGRNFSETAEVEANRRLNSGVLKRTDKRNLLPSAGILLQPSKKITLYGSYAESFVPNDPALQDINGNIGVFTPIEGKQYELGIKTENLFNNRLSLTSAIYRIDQVGQVTTDPCPFGTCATQIGKGRSEGFEIEGNASPIDNLQLIFGYSHIKATVLSAKAAQSFQVGRQLPNVARDAANLWTRYDWDNGFGIGAGVTYTGKREGVLPTAITDLRRILLPAYTLVDLGVYYTGKSFSLNLKVGNVFDEKYIENTGATARIQVAPGQPRYATLTARTTF